MVEEKDDRFPLAVLVDGIEETVDALHVLAWNFGQVELELGSLRLRAHDPVRSGDGTIEPRLLDEVNALRRDEVVKRDVGLGRMFRS